MREVSRPLRYLLAAIAIVVTTLAWSGVSFKELLTSLYR
jgi:hypothetical protein